MLKKVTNLFLMLALTAAVSACGGGSGGDRAEGVQPGPDEPGGQVPVPPPELPAAPGYADATQVFAFITAAQIPESGFTEVTFQVTDEKGDAIVDLELEDVRFVLSKLRASELGGATGEWQSYINTIEEPDSSVGPGTEPRLQATYEDFRAGGDLLNNLDGTYTYTYVTDVNNPDPDILAQAQAEDLDVSYEPERPHRVAIQFGGGPNPINPYYDWVPATGLAAAPAMQIAATANCNRCHDPLAIHGGGRIEVEYCVTCHNPGSTDAHSGNSVAMKNMVHKIHMGANLPSVQAGGSYIIYGYRNSEHDYSHVQYPQDPRNCQNCHVGTGTSNEFYPDVALTNQGDNWAEYATRDTCGSCHDLVDWDTHARGQPDDSRCASCHQEGGRAGSIASSHALLIRDEAARYDAVVEHVASSGPGDKPSVDIRVTNPYTGEDYDILGDDPFINDGASLNVKLAWSTTDYTNTGNGETNASTISQSALSSATPNGDGSFNVLFDQALPDSGTPPGVAASGSGVAIIDGHPTVVIEEGEDPENIPIRDAHAFFSIDEADGMPVERRDSADIGACLSCHQNLVLHGQNRADNLQSCVACHNPRNTDRDTRAVANNPPTDGKQEESIDMKTMIHAIHAAGMRENPLQIVGFRGFNTYVFDEEHVQYPGRLGNCVTCHGDDGFELPLAAGVLATTVDTGSDPSDPADDLVTTAATAVCASCHDSDLATGHMIDFGGRFATTQAAIDDGTEAEGCDLCHAAGRDHEVRRLHGVD
ncbi:OmcA/MtrC family decaheme c-type cytochrome [Halieaceae bacterium IMCC14734]|uniref:OmcA/MtrC family decaheme c-type cytochrome n=1 Tax=Candidatus Litorirhabdus singularis TaxID=2518993 RepID=A0ABT3TMA4_9GAMM|nr:OmcA/MtrC family decaheme c-type cytochrome [Candidatus Litorirhabdus singularis]MCX2982529.1 OmcA/MtrC family decaheme c-type cytochrome [Candidatus Litorirhabdus singularis]